MFRKAFNKISKENVTIFYKLLNDSLFIALLFFFLMLIGEGLLPGIISTRISFSVVIIFIAVNILLIRKLADYLNISKGAKTNKKALLLGAFVFAIFILNSLVKLFQFNLFLAILVFLLVLATGYFIYKLAFDTEGHSREGLPRR